MVWPSPHSSVVKELICITRWAGEKPVPTPRIVVRPAAKRSLLTEVPGIPVGLPVDGAYRHEMTLVRAAADSLPVQRPRPVLSTPRACAWIRVTTLMRCSTPWRSSASRLTAVAGARRLKPLKGRSVSKPRAGCWNALTAGCTAFDAFRFAGEDQTHDRQDAGSTLALQAGFAGRLP